MADIAPAGVTGGNWSYACDSYGKVRHSKMACVYTVLVDDKAEQIVSIAARIKNWEDAKLIAAAPHMARVLRAVLHQLTHGEAADAADASGDSAADLRWCRQKIQEVLQLMT